MQTSTFLRGAKKKRHLKTDKTDQLTTLILSAQHDWLFSSFNSNLVVIIINIFLTKADSHCHTKRLV